MAALTLRHLDQFGGVNRVLRMCAEVMGKYPAVGLLLDIKAQPLGQIAAIEGILPLADGQKHHQHHHQQASCRQHQRPHPLNGESRAQFATPSRAASRWASLSPSSLHKSRAVAPDSFSTAAVNSTSWRTFSSTCRAATDSNSKSSSRKGVSEPKSMRMCPSAS